MESTSDSAMDLDLYSVFGAERETLFVCGISQGRGLGRAAHNGVYADASLEADAHPRLDGADVITGVCGLFAIDHFSDGILAGTLPAAVEKHTEAMRHLIEEGQSEILGVEDAGAVQYGGAAHDGAVGI